MSTLSEYVTENKIDIILYQDPYRKELVNYKEQLKWNIFQSLRHTCGIIVANPKINAIQCKVYPNSVFINVTTKSEPITIGTIYSPPPFI